DLGRLALIDFDGEAERAQLLFELLGDDRRRGDGGAAGDEDLLHGGGPLPIARRAASVQASGFAARSALLTRGNRDGAMLMASTARPNKTRAAAGSPAISPHTVTLRSCRCAASTTELTMASTRGSRGAATARARSSPRTKAVRSLVPMHTKSEAFAI